jgi:hypothetical protein
MKYCMKTAYLQNLYEIKIYVSFEMNLILNITYLICNYVVISFHSTTQSADFTSSAYASLQMIIIVELLHCSLFLEIALLLKLTT